MFAVGYLGGDGRGSVSPCTSITKFDSRWKLCVVLGPGMAVMRKQPPVRRRARLRGPTGPAASQARRPSRSAVLPPQSSPRFGGLRVHGGAMILLRDVTLPP